MVFELRLKSSQLVNSIALLALSMLIFSQPGVCGSAAQYTPWGVDEYQLLGLTKEELSKKFKDKLFFSEKYDRAAFSQSGTGLGYQGAVFKLSFRKGRVASVQGVFEGCKQDFERPRFNSKEVAIKYAIKGLSSYTGEKEKKSLSKARQALAKLKRSKAAK